MKISELLAVTQQALAQFGDAELAAEFGRDHDLCFADISFLGLNGCVELCKERRADAPADAREKDVVTIVSATGVCQEFNEA